LGNGLHFIPPYARVVKYPVRLIEITQAGDNLVETRVNNGLTVKLDCTVLYTIDASMAAEVYSKVATSVGELGYKILLPLLRTAIRDVVSRYSAEELYSSKREFISGEIETTLRALVATKGLLLDRFLIRGIFLPEEVDRAIQAKIASQQEAEAMTYKKQKAEQEAEIKIIEARGLAKAQEIINSTLTPTYLQHEAIQSYKELAGSPNTTFVIMPTSPTATGMPLILNAQR
jgi:regulator of protease activity HflC (stomatin/prohibitin superfamily)